MKAFVACLIAAVAVAVVSAETYCERRRRILQEFILVPIVPECDENGDFKERQCHKDHSFCQCWTKEGDVISPPSKNLKHCECWKEHHEANKDGHLIGTYIPSCETDGTYSKKQCWGSTGTCWCVDENGNKLTEPVRGEVNC